MPVLRNKIRVWGRVFFTVLGLAVAAGRVNAVRAGEAAFVPHFESLTSDKVNLRQGPGFKYRVLWVFHRKNLPVKVLAEYDVWRRIKTPDGTVGWVHRVMLSERRSILVTGTQKAAIRNGNGPGSKTIALAEPGVTAMLDRCKLDACEVSIGDTTGWIEKKNIWGVGAGEVVPK